ncbi:MAG TPA: hypothetical protein VKO63_08950 [Chitinispirillaceae bacterium]|nr:hypothetical protein [Chitinispirillaceae bacterium]
MGFGLNVKVEVPKVEVPKVEVPKVDVAAAAKNMTSSVTGAVSGAIDSAKSTVNSAVDSAKSAVAGAVDSAKSAVAGAVDSAKSAVDGAVSAATDAVESAKASLATVAGAIAEVAVSFKGAIEDIVLEPHLSLDANASFGKTKFEKGPIWIRVEDNPAEAKTNTDTIHIFSGSGTYDKTQKVCDFTDNNEKTVVLLFEEAPMGERYSLEVIRADGGKKTIFSNITYGDLRKTKQRFV